MVRLIASDLDGTLLRPDGSVSGRVRAARAAGLAVVLVTTRPPLTAGRFARESGVGGPAICSIGVEASDVIAFGDARNDLPMLRWAGRGVAVANAHGAVLAEADEVTPSNREDGVAVVLERLLEERTALIP